MTTDNRTNGWTQEQIEATARAMRPPVWAPSVTCSDAVQKAALERAWHEGFCKGEISGLLEMPLNPDECNPYRQERKE